MGTFSGFGRRSHRRRSDAPANSEPAFNRPTNGTCEDRLQAVRELHECWWAFRAWFGIEPRRFDDGEEGETR